MRPDRTQEMVRLARELVAEIDLVERTVRDGEAILGGIGQREPARVELYAAAAVLHTFYNGVEKVFSRISPALNGGLPDGGDWHQRLLRNMTLDLQDLRPAVLRTETAARIDDYLAFRHKFRHLYLFDLDWQRIRELLTRLRGVWDATRAELRRFVEFVERLAAAP